MNDGESIADLEGILDTMQGDLQSISGRLDEVCATLSRLQNVEIATMQGEVQSISGRLDEARAVLSRLQNVEMEEVSPHDGALPGMNSKLSDAARFAIETSKGPLEPEDLKKFLMEEAFGKPKPDILPIVRKYTNSVEGLIEQLIHVKDMNNQTHIRYKEEQRKLDMNLNKRIDTLVANMRKELAKEGDQGLSQMSIDQFVRRRPRQI